MSDLSSEHGTTSLSHNKHEVLAMVKRMQNAGIIVSKDASNSKQHGAAAGLALAGVFAWGGQ